MQNMTPVKKLKTVLCSYLVMGSLAGACYSQAARPQAIRKDASPEGSVTVYVLITPQERDGAVQKVQDPKEGGAP